MQFNSAGFDVSDASGGDVVYEIGGGATPAAPETEGAANRGGDGNDNDDAMAPAEAFKRRGNDAFRERNWELARELYTQAIEATPGMTAVELLRLRAEFLERQGLEMRQRYAEQEEERRKAKADKDSQGEEPKANPPDPFVAPPHEHGDKLSVYHCNRAAVYLHLQDYEEAVRDCDAAILWNPTYTKALVRRCQAHEGLDKTDKALEDAKLALEMDPANVSIRQTVKRLEKIEAERLEKLKTETMEKLKDLGNSILGNFGLSLDNFKAVQDPKTGSYSISFGNN